MSQITSETPPNRAPGDIWIGLVLIALGGGAGWMANGFDAVSRAYPLALSVLLTVLGFVLTVRALLGRGEDPSFARAVHVVVPATVVLALWILGLSNGLGYLAPTFAMELAFMWLCGVRGPGRAAAYAALVTAGSYAVFVGLLDVRLPASHLPWLF